MINTIEKFYSVTEFADKIGVSRETVRRWIKANKISAFPITRVGCGFLKLIPESDLLKIQNERGISE